MNKNVFKKEIKDNINVISMYTNGITRLKIEYNHNNNTLYGIKMVIKENKSNVFKKISNTSFEDTDITMLNHIIQEITLRILKIYTIDTLFTIFNISSKNNISNNIDNLTKEINNIVKELLLNNIKDSLFRVYSI